MSQTRQGRTELRSRDAEVLRGLLDARVMTRPHITSLYFGGRTDAAKKRLQKLKRAGWISERPRRPNERGAIHLTLRGFDALTQNDDREDYPRLRKTLSKRLRVSEQTLRHELAVMDVKAATSSAIAREALLTLVQFSTWPARSEFQAVQPALGLMPGRRVTVRPDGFIQFRDKEGDDYRFFLEVDRSTESLDTLVAKAACYRDFYRRGGFALRCGGATNEIDRYPFVVLVVVKSVERRDNIALRLLEMSPPILTQVWITTASALLTDPLGSVWLTPLAHRDSGERGSPTLLRLLD